MFLNAKHSKSRNKIGNVSHQQDYLKLLKGKQVWSSCLSHVVSRKLWESASSLFYCSLVREACWLCIWAPITSKDNQQISKLTKPQIHMHTNSPHNYPSP